MEVLLLVTELWRDIAAYQGLYQVSNLGRIKRLAGSYGTKEDRLLSPTLNDGYPRVTLFKQGKGRSHFVHVLIAEAFIGPRHGHLEVNHIDGNKENNLLSNLEYVTPSSNRLHAYQKGLIDIRNRQGSRNANAKLSETEAKQIRDRLATGESVNALARQHQVSWDTIADIRDQMTWTHI